MTDRITPRMAFVIVAAALLLLSSCGIEKPGDESSGDQPSAAGSNIKITGPDSVPKVNEGKSLKVAFFGFARANSFASATFEGIKEYTGKHNAAATFFDPNFDAQTQVSQIQDAVTSNRYQVFVVQANDGTAVIPAVEQAVAADITVVVEFTPVGTRYNTVEPQVDGTINLVDVPTDGGKVLGQGAITACKKLKEAPCSVAYLEGDRTLPLDNARTKAVKGVLSSADGVNLDASVQGGYTNESGRQAMQDVLQAHPDVDVVVGSSQAIAGAERVAGDNDIAFIGNGGSRQAVDAVKSGRWFGIYGLPEVTNGATAAALGLADARGADVPIANHSLRLTPSKGIALKDDLKGVEGEYDE